MKSKRGGGPSGNQRHRQQHSCHHPPIVEPAQKIRGPRHAVHGPKHSLETEQIRAAQEDDNGKRRQAGAEAGSSDRPLKRSKLDPAVMSNEQHGDVTDRPSTHPYQSGQNTLSDVPVINVTSGTKIEAKVTRILGTLSRFSDAQATDSESNIVSLSAKGSAVAKLTSIVEIAKRQMSDQNQKWYQYSQLDSLRQEIPRRKTTFEDRAPEEEEDEEEQAFVAMRTPIERALEGTPKIRAVPLLKIHLSKVSIEVLKRRFGEQTNAQPQQA